MKCWDKFICHLVILPITSKARDLLSSASLQKHWLLEGKQRSFMCLSMKGNKGAIHVKSALFLPCTMWTSLDLLAGPSTCALLFLVTLGVPGRTGCEGGLSTHTDSAFCQFCPVLASNSPIRKLFSEQTIAHRVNERQGCGLALEVLPEASWLGNVGKLPPLWP